MRLHGVSLGLAIATLSTSILADVVTITEYASTCRATYTVGSNTATVVQSTVYVVPTPLTDSALNSGTPFILSVTPGTSGSKRRRAASAYLTSSGYTSPDRSQAAHYHIDNGTLRTASHGWVTTNDGVQNEPFTAVPNSGSITTDFLFQDLSLQWLYSSFDGGAAAFYTIPTGNGDQQIIVRFSGVTEPEWVPIILKAQAVGGIATYPAGSSQSMSVSTVITMGSMTIPYTSTPATYPSPTSNVNPNGICGGTSGFNCYGAPDGNCCSSYGYCGQGAGYCDSGCQIGFGDCDDTSSSSVATTTASSIASYAAPSASPSSNVSPDGQCGGTSGFNCYGAPSGSCCGQYGYCGTGAGYCDAGCQVGFGTCDRSAGSSISGYSTPVSPSGASSSLPNGGSASATYPVTAVSTPTMSSDTTLPTYSVPSQPIGPVGPVSSTGESVMTSPTAATSPLSAPDYTSGSMTVSSNAVSVPSVVSSLTTLSFDSYIASGSSTPTSVPVVMSLPTGSTSSAASSSVVSTSSAAAPTATGPICPAGNGTIYTDPQGAQYMIGCGEDTTGTLDGITQTTNSVVECMTACDAAAGCIGFTWLGANGAVNGEGAGNCYLKMTGPIYFSDTGGISDSKVGALLVSPAGQSVADSSSTVASTSSTTASISTPITAASVTTPATSTSSSTSSTSAYLIIPSPTPCDFGDPPNTDEDDSYCEVDLPQAMTMYTSSDTATFPGVNGYISLTQGSIDYQAEAFPTPNLPNSTIGPLFDDWYIYGLSTPQQGIWYSLDTTGVWYEYYVARAGNQGDIMHFTVRYNYASPGVFTYTYYTLSGEDGAFASVGMQGVDVNGNQVGYTYSFQTADITAGLVLTCNTLTNTCTAGS